jgi:hypothetical protein
MSAGGNVGPLARKDSTVTPDTDDDRPEPVPNPEPPVERQHEDWARPADEDDDEEASYP